MGHFRIHAQAIVDLEEIYCYIAVERVSRCC
jgi:hypothetical protein